MSFIGVQIWPVHSCEGRLQSYLLDCTTADCLLLHITKTAMQTDNAAAARAADPCPAHLSQGLSVGAHVGEDDQHMLLTLVSQKLSRGQGQTGCDDTLNAGEGPNRTLDTGNC